ncbi:lipoprotein NlpI [Alteromonas sp. ASW11-36]|uniref:Lipoprotein NlpI n=1 Tax=Alteromonas arenosi TaxID=3055817 RepID=A0ABT7SYP9_9ALTE|nr:lipoprotein NlpI [Alteromonas sp. ASW11-36]MDM7860654.1 lipoprotein NlpI [Alteromonas sp. ASW11-36]
MLQNIKILIPLSFLLLSGCAQLPQQPAAQMGNLLLVEPIPANPRAQLAVARFNYILGQANIEDGERAELLYQRGMLYDSLGLSSLAQFDYSQVLKLRPDMAEAYNSIGIHYVQQQDFSQAYDAFDSSIDINPDYDFAYLNRGIALYYGGKPELAVEDLAVFQQRKPTDPYRAIWHFIAAREVDEIAALEQLRAARPGLDPTFWANNIVDFYLGDIDENTLLNSLIVDIENRTELNNRVCEAYFYIGKHHSRVGQRGKASNYFKLALSTNVYEFVEHRFARLELERLADSQTGS